MSNVIAIQATISGFGGEPGTVFSGYDQDSKILVVSKAVGYKKDRFRSCLVITNNKDLDNESLFGVEQFNDAIKAFYALRGGVASDSRSRRLSFDNDASRANPENAIEQDGLDANGPRYRISPDLTNIQAAVLATCLYAVNADSISDVVEMAEMFRQFEAGAVITV
ncbi:hypothetical protein [Uliginosibacterium sediminicola]|uniref:Uncharacterized protein n=1 Tax=Uliginosibacterium sediminicola TaxID=2024550 RepID=A0ABU9YWF8_9RHOO